MSRVIGLENYFISDKTQLSAKIKLDDVMIEVDVLDYDITPSGLVKILTVEKELYMTHLSNVVLYSKDVIIEK